MDKLDKKHYVSVALAALTCCSVILEAAVPVSRDKGVDTDKIVSAGRTVAAVMSAIGSGEEQYYLD